MAGGKRSADRQRVVYRHVGRHSANDATVALAEEVAGSETAFVEMMNEKAEDSGFYTYTHFLNSTGLPQDMYPDPPQVDGEHLMSAKDSATLAKYLIEDFPNITEFTTIDKATFREGEPGAIDMINWNRMIKGLEHEYEGVDGLKAERLTRLERVLRGRPFGTTCG